MTAFIIIQRHLKQIIQESAADELHSMVRRLLRTTSAEQYAALLKGLAEN